MRFQVPQFIEIESKIFGPLTLKQFIYLAGSAGIVFLLYISLPFFLVILFGIPVAAVAIALAFYKVNNQPFIKVIENALRFSSTSKIYIWKKQEVRKKAQTKSQALQASKQIYVPKLTKNKLRDLSWSLDIKEQVK